MVPPTREKQTLGAAPEPWTWSGGRTIGRELCRCAVQPGAQRVGKHAGAGAALRETGATDLLSFLRVAQSSGSEAVLSAKMVPAGLKPGVPVILWDLEPSSKLFKQGASLRVIGTLSIICGDSATAVIQDGSVRFKIDTQHLRDVSFRTNSVYQFIGELLICADDEAILQARIGRNVDGLDLNLYHQSLVIRQQHEAKLRSSRRA